MNFLKLKLDYLYILFLLSVSILYTINTDLIDITIMEARNFITAKEIQLENNWLKLVNISKFDSELAKRKK